MTLSLFFALFLIGAILVIAVLDLRSLDDKPVARGGWTPRRLPRDS